MIIIIVGLGSVAMDAKSNTQVFGLTSCSVVLDSSFGPSWPQFVYYCNMFEW